MVHILLLRLREKEVTRVEIIIRRLQLVDSEMMVKVHECRVCHGTRRLSEDLSLTAWSLVPFRAITEVSCGYSWPKSQNRSEYLMGVGAKINNQVEIAYLADWFAKQKPKPAIRTIRDKVLGKKLYEQRCTQCHGERAEETTN